MWDSKKLNNKLNGCSLEQDGEDFYIVGADSVRKKLGSGDFTITFTVSGSSTVVASYSNRHYSPGNGNMNIKLKVCNGKLTIESSTSLNYSGADQDSSTMYGNQAVRSNGSISVSNFRIIQDT